MFFRQITKARFMPRTILSSNRWLLHLFVIRMRTKSPRRENECQYASPLRHFEQSQFNRGRTFWKIHRRLQQKALLLVRLYSYSVFQQKCSSASLFSSLTNHHTRVHAHRHAQIFLSLFHTLTHMHTRLHAGPRSVQSPSVPLSAIVPTDFYIFFSFLS